VLTAQDIFCARAELDLSSDRRPVESSQRKEAIARIEDDLGDILLHLLELANAYSVDLAEAFEKTLVSNKKRFGLQ
jgi:NTP pyrophosphatase (non-canonical NTP hydrolase)